MGLKAHSLTSIASESREHFGRRLSFFFQNGIFHPSREDFSLIRLNSRAKVSVQAESSVGVRRLPATEPYAHAANAGRSDNGIAANAIGAPIGRGFSGCSNCALHLAKYAPTIKPGSGASDHSPTTAFEPTSLSQRAADIVAICQKSGVPANQVGTGKLSAAGRALNASKLVNAQLVTSCTTCKKSDAVNGPQSN